MTADMKTKEIKKKPECSKFPITKIIKCIRIHPLNWKERVFITNEIGKYLDQMQAEEDEINQEKLVRVFSPLPDNLNVKFFQAGFVEEVRDIFEKQSN